MQLIRIGGKPKPEFFDNTVPTGQVGTQGNNITDRDGNRICGGGMNAGINQRTTGQ